MIREHLQRLDAAGWPQKYERHAPRKPATSGRWDDHDASRRLAAATAELYKAPVGGQPESRQDAGDDVDLARRVDSLARDGKIAALRSVVVTIGGIAYPGDHEASRLWARRTLAKAGPTRTDGGGRVRREDGAGCVHGPDRRCVGRCFEALRG